MEQRPKGILNFLSIYVAIVALELTHVLMTDSLQSAMLIGFMRLIFIFLAYGLFFGYAGQLKFLIGFNIFLALFSWSAVLTSDVFNIRLALTFCWAVFCTALSIYLFRVKDHEFYQRSNTLTS